jgi:hypothetical protein
VEINILIASSSEVLQQLAAGPSQVLSSTALATFAYAERTFSRNLFFPQLIVLKLLFLPFCRYNKLVHNMICHSLLTPDN